MIYIWQAYSKHHVVYVCKYNCELAEKSNKIHLVLINFTWQVNHIKRYLIRRCCICLNLEFWTHFLCLDRSIGSIIRVIEISSYHNCYSYTFLNYESIVLYILNDGIQKTSKSNISCGSDWQSKNLLKNKNSSWLCDLTFFPCFLVIFYTLMHY